MLFMTAKLRDMKINLYMMTKPIKILLLLVLSVLLPSGLQAQSGFVVTGTDVSGSGGTVSNTIGQIAFKTINTDGISIAQGVQQPFEILTLGTEMPDINLTFLAYPNPTDNLLSLSIGNYDSENLSLALYAITGKLLEQRKIQNAVTTIAMTGYPSAMYVLEIIKGNKKIKTFKIIKN